MYVWTADFPSRQKRIELTAATVGVAFLLALIWLLFLSRWPRKVRLLSFVAIVLLLGSIPALFRVRGISGDILPILEWRWSKKAVEALPANSFSAADTISIKMPAVSPIHSPEDSATQSAANHSKPAAKKIEPASPVLLLDYPQFLGPNRDAKVHGIKLRRDWTNHPPQLVWRQPVGAGWSAFAVTKNFAITQEQRGKQEMVVAYDLRSGKVKWSHSDSAEYESPITGNGPRATPTIVNHRVYTLGATGRLNCLELETGRLIWSKDIVKDNDSQILQWGLSGSPLALDSLIVVNAGGQNGNSLVAYHQNTGARIWSGGSDRAAYSSPLVTTLAGVRQILIFNQNAVASHDPATGQVLWQQEWPSGSECVAQPVQLPGDRVFVSSGYGIGCKLFQIARSDNGDLQATLVWENNRLKAKFTNVVYHDGYIFGLDDGILVCLDPANGERKWKAGRYGHGQMIGVDDLLLIQAESGDVVLVEANPAAPQELARFSALNGKTWNNPALAGRYLLVRNDREAACYELPPSN
jgi:outer membrane protein assembly factor BamB